MNLLKKSISGLAIITTVAIGTEYVNNFPFSPSDEEVIKKAEKVDDRKDIVDWDVSAYSFKSSLVAESKIRELAGFYSGTVSINDLCNGFTSSASGSDNSLLKVLVESDLNNDGVITYDEVDAYQESICDLLGYDSDDSYV